MFKHEFQDRNQNIENFFLFLTESNAKVNNILFMKSSLCIAIYNNIEATAYSAFEKLHSEIKLNEFNKFSSKTKKIYLEYYFKDKKFNAENYDNFLLGSLPFPSFIEYSKNEKVFSGNVDSRLLSKTMEKYGINNLNVKKHRLESMLFIKSKRNSIAHGEVNMIEGGQNLSNQKIKILIDDTREIMMNFIEKIEIHINEKRFLSTQ